MRPLTDTCPKALVEVAGRPLIDHVLDRLATAGVAEAVVNVHHFADQIEAHLARRVAGPPVRISDERGALLETGGGLKKALPAFKGAPLLTINSDTIWVEGVRPNLVRLIEGFDPERMDVLMLTASASLSVGYDGRGDFVMDPYGRLERRAERQVAPFVYAGACMLNPGLFEDTPDGPFSLNLIFDKAAAAERLFGLRLEGQWMHVGTPDAIHEAEEAIHRSSD